jgi:flagellar biosynthetic protein FliR
MMDTGILARFGLLLVRPGMLMLAAPAFGGTYAPAQVKIGLTVLIAVAIGASTPIPTPEPVLALGLIVTREAAIGLALALAIRALVAGAELAGQLSGFQMGLSYAATVDPQSGVRNTVIATLYSNLTVLAFFILNAHHAFLRALVGSYATLPIGMGSVAGSMPRVVMHLLGLVFTLGARLAAPIVAVGLLAELALGLLARSAPSLNLMAVSPSVRALVGLLVLAMAAPSVIGVAGSFMNTVLQLGIEAAQAFR